MAWEMSQEQLLGLHRWVIINPCTSLFSSGTRVLHLPLGVEFSSKHKRMKLSWLREFPVSGDSL